MTQTSGLIQTSFGNIYVEQYGEITPENTLVFLHDAIGSVSIMGSFPKLVFEATNLPVVVIDRIGYGKSDDDSRTRTTDYLQFEAEQRLPEILEKLGITNPILIGHSDGGTIALAYAASFPVKALVSMAAHIYEEEITRQGIQAFFDQPNFTEVKSKLANHHGSKTDKILNGWRDTWLSEEYKSWNINALLPKVKCPSLLLQGDRDEYATFKHLLDIATQVRGKRSTHLIKDCGHVPYKEQKPEVLKLVTNFILAYQ